MGNEQKMGTNRPTLNRLTSLDAKISNQKQKIKKKALGTKRTALGYGPSTPWVRIVQTLGTKHPIRWE